MKFLDGRTIWFALLLACLVAIGGVTSAWAGEIKLLCDKRCPVVTPAKAQPQEISPYVLASGYTKKQLREYLARRIAALDVERFAWLGH